MSYGSRAQVPWAGDIAASAGWFTSDVCTRNRSHSVISKLTKSLRVSGVPVRSRFAPASPYESGAPSLYRPDCRPFCRTHHARQHSRTRCLIAVVPCRGWDLGRADGDGVLGGGGVDDAELDLAEAVVAGGAEDESVVVGHQPPVPLL
eukprot:2359715-Rhodomonas_salina.2